MPLANAVRLLQANVILEIVKVALEDVLHGAQNLDQENATEANRGNSIMSESSATLDGDAGIDKDRISRKRKRTTIAEDQRLSSTSDEGLLLVSLNLMRFLDRMIEKSRDPKTSNSEVASAPDHLRLILTAETPLAADLLGHWLWLLVHLSSQNFQNGQYIFHNILEDVMANTSFLHLWADRSTVDVDNTDLVQVCLMCWKILSTLLTSTENFL